jgi:dTDP-4-amino-4,6-dideoxygalactose transaminase
MMRIKVGRTLPPAAAPLAWSDLWRGVTGSLRPDRTRRAREEEIRCAFGVRHVFLVSSGTAALTLALEALKTRSKRTDVVIPAYTCYSVPAAILAAGLRPVPCDIDPSTFDFDHGLLRQTISANTLCVVAHHLFGVPSDVERLRVLCEAAGCFLVEDAAQAMGVECHGRKLGTMGDVGIFSLGRGKNITCGSGGILVTNDARLGDALARLYGRVWPPGSVRALTDIARLVLMTVFVRPRLYWIPAAMPFLHLGETIFPRAIVVHRLSGMQAGLLRGWRARLDRSNGARSKAARYFSQRLPLGLARVAHPYLRLPLLLADASEKHKLFTLSRQRGLGLSVAYPAPISEIPGVRIVTDGRQFPSAKRLAATLVTIPTHHLLCESDMAAIAELCRDFRSA